MKKSEDKVKSLADVSPTEDQKAWELRLYVAGQTPKSLAAFQNLKKLCEEHLKGQYRIEVVDLLVNPQLAREDEILALPTLVRKIPQPLRRIIGDLSNAEKVLVGLQIRTIGANKNQEAPDHE